MRIKFLDTGEILEVTTASQLANTKVRVTPETSDNFQTNAWDLGVGWAGKRYELDHLDKPFLFIYNWGALAWHDDEEYFASVSVREFELLPP